MLSNERSNWNLAVLQTFIAVGAFSQMTSEVEPGHMKQRDLALLKIEGLELLRTTSEAQKSTF